MPKYAASFGEIEHGGDVQREVAALERIGARDVTQIGRGYDDETCTLAFDLDHDLVWMRSNFEQAMGRQGSCLEDWFIR